MSAYRQGVWKFAEVFLQKTKWSVLLVRRYVPDTFTQMSFLHEVSWKNITPGDIFPITVLSPILVEAVLGMRGFLVSNT